MIRNKEDDILKCVAIKGVREFEIKEIEVQGENQQYIQNTKNIL